MDKKYLTIKEYADIKGVSVSSVYKRLNKTLQPYYVEVEGKKMLKQKVLEDEGLIDVSTKVEENSSTPLQPSSTFLQDQIRQKDKQIELLNEQIKELQESNKSKDDYIQEQGRKLTELLEQSNILLQNNQLLLAKPEANKEEVEVADVSVVEPEVEKDEADTEVKKGFFSRLFGGN